MVSARLAACVNLVKTKSLYTWKGNLEETEEYLAIFKTTKANIEALKKTIHDRHPYEVPEIIEIPLRDINHSYLNWLKDVTSQR